MKLLTFTIFCIFVVATHAKSTFIANGHDSQIVPSYAYLEIFNQSNTDYLYFGGGSLISTTFVLTVAQNVDGFYRWKVGLGANRISDMEWFDSLDAVIHPDYSSRQLTDNIALIRLSQPVLLSDKIQIANLVPQSATFPEKNTVLQVVGFGFTTFGPHDHQPDVLQRAEIVVNGQEYCELMYPHLLNTQHINNYFCANNTIQSNICAGDQGGPVYNIPTLLQVGIQSFMRVADCTDVKSQPGAFIRIASYNNWISSIAGI